MDWALESCRIVTAPDTYPAKRVIDNDYLLAHRPIVDLRLRQAGLRLADMINFALRTPAPGAPAAPAKGPEK